MEKMILSLKSIYMLLMNEDFPIYSESVISRMERKGQTMLRFWQGQIAEEFRCMPCGKMIWRNDGRRNRYTSYLCNRSAEIKTYAEYARELASQVSAAALLDQIGRFSDFLSARKYRHDVLLRRVQELLRLTETEDPRVTREIADHIREAVDWQSEDGQEKLFQASYLMTLLMLYAAAGEAMDEPVMAVLRGEEYSLETLWRNYTTPEEEGASATFLTVHSGLLQDNPLPLHRFFGREKELFDLTESAASNRKCLITGIGGVGKTELLRQVIRRCCEEQMVDRIAVVPYEGNLIESFARCFPDFQRQDSEGSFHSILYRMEKESKTCRVLLVIDDLTCKPEEDPALAWLTQLPFAILMTSRLSAPEGFEAYPLSDPTVSTGTLIFRDNYGMPLSREDQQVLADILENKALCHPLTLRLMARAARSRGWTVRELQSRLAKKDTALSWQEEGRTVRLGQVYRQLYSYMRIPEACQDLAELFTLLPRDSYSLEFLTRWFPDVVDAGAMEKLEALTAGGWLDQDDSGYSMHPLIAQCLRRTVITEERVEPMIGHLRTFWVRYQLEKAPVEEETIYRLCGIFRHIASFLTGKVSYDFLLALAVVCASEDALPHNAADGQRLLDVMEKRCAEKDDRIEISCLTRRCNWLIAPKEQCTEMYRRQKEHLTVPVQLYMDFCLAGGSLMIWTYADYDFAETLLREVLAGPADVDQRADAYGTLIDCVSYQSRREEAIRLSEEGYAHVKEHPECSDRITCGILSRLCQSYMILDKLESAGKYIPEIRERFAETPYPLSKYYLCIALRVYSSDCRDYESALTFAQVENNLALQLRGKNVDYYTSRSGLANQLRLVKRYEEALSCYEEVLTFMRGAQNVFWIWQASNNASVVCLEQERPEKALEYLEEALPYAKNMGGHALAETQKNRARAFGQLGDTEQEYACLQEASPLLDAAYGPGHPRAAAARQRLAELENRELQK